jgi:hypothetical protein
VLHFYAAYPEATMVTVRQAIAAGRLARAASSRLPWGRERALERLAGIVRGPAPEAVPAATAVGRAVAAQVAALLPRRGVHPFTLATPIDPEAGAGPADHLRGLDDRASPLAALGDTHFARFVLLPRHLQTLGRPPQDDAGADYLLFTSTPFGPIRRHVERLCALGAFADRVWGTCAGYPGTGRPARLAAWFQAHRLPTSYFVAGYPSLRPAAVVDRLVLRAELERTVYGRRPDAEWVRAARTAAGAP